MCDFNKTRMLEPTADGLSCKLNAVLNPKPYKLQLIIRCEVAFVFFLGFFRLCFHLMIWSVTYLLYYSASTLDEGAQGNLWTAAQLIWGRGVLDAVADLDKLRN